VEFVKRYYSEYLYHDMPNSYGHAKDFYQKGTIDGSLNTDRNLIQYSNRGESKPQVDDIIVFDGWHGNKYGHIAIVSKISKNNIEIVQQNVGSKSRQKLKLKKSRENRIIKNSKILGWLRKTGQN